MSDVLYAKAKKSPFLVAGMVGFVAVGGIGAYKWRTRTIPVSLFLIQLRVAAQGTVVGCLTIGMLHQMYKGYQQMQEKKE
ncbi:HIG1 domain family member 1C [Dufourea novaeangliae]|uniref:HIG1 domain family member 1C n=2 Tax=Dufourea novaeangliae TaxID=178035 RepID=A0A154NXF0_DUFNO|nr:HIG1 domain family member 1C [Dufourea novaeangliae]